MQLGGSCHCGQLVVRLDTEKSPGELPIRICGCSFCVKHRPRYTADPGGSVHFQIKSETSLSRYRFGLQLADFLICRTCGVFVGAFGDGRAVVNLDVLARAADFTQAPTRFAAYDSETVATRSERRANNWTPATLEIG